MGIWLGDWLADLKPGSKFRKKHSKNYELQQYAGKNRSRQPVERLQVKTEVRWTSANNAPIKRNSTRKDGEDRNGQADY